MDIELTKEKILYNHIDAAGGFKGITFEKFQDMMINGSPDMVKGTKATLAAMEFYAELKVRELKNKL